MSLFVAGVKGITVVIADESMTKQICTVTQKYIQVMRHLFLSL